MKKILIALCTVFMVVIGMFAARQGTVAFDRPDIGTARTRLDVGKNFKAQNKDICPQFLKRFNRQYHTEASRDGKGYAATQDATEDCEAEQRTSGVR